MPTVDGVGDGVGGRVDHRHVVTAVVGDVDVGAVVGHPVRGVADGDGVGDGVGGRVDHRHVVTVRVGDVDVGAVVGHPVRDGADGDGVVTVLVAGSITDTLLLPSW